MLGRRVGDKQHDGCTIRGEEWKRMDGLDTGQCLEKKKEGVRLVVLLSPCPKERIP